MKKNKNDPVFNVIKKYKRKEIKDAKSNLIAWWSWYRLKKLSKRLNFPYEILTQIPRISC